MGALTRARFAELLRFEKPDIALIDSATSHEDGYILETLALEIGGTRVRGLLTRPGTGAGPFPAILYAHSHGGGYAVGARELLDGRDYLEAPLGPVLARAGYVTLAIDMPVFGARATETESAAAKALLWKGKSLIGQMVCEQAAALDYLAGRPDVDTDRIGAFGMSMGATLSCWLAALEGRIAAVAHLCCFADQRAMIELGAHDGHGIYMTVPGLLAETDAGEIAALIAPRPQLIGIGGADSLTPPLAVARARSDLEPAYAGTTGRLRVIEEPGTGHVETPAMREAVLAFFAETL